MPPPPVPIDPALDTLNALDVGFASGIGDHFLPSSPAIHHRLRYPGTSATIGAILHDVQLPAMRQPDLDTNPMSRFQNDQGPWTPQHIGGDLTQPSHPPGFQSSYGPHYMPVTLSSQYRDPPKSEQGSSMTGRNPVDSGYRSRSLATKSVRSVEPVEQSQGCQSLIGDVNDMRVYADDHYPPPIPEQVVTFPNENLFSYPIPTSEPTEPHPAPFTCTFSGCHNHVSRNLSELRFVQSHIPHANAN